MSRETPNEYERAIEEYARSVREHKQAQIDLAKAFRTESVTSLHRQEAWRKVKAFVNQGAIKPGIYEVSSGSSSFREGISVDTTHDYPEILDIYR